MRNKYHVAPVANRTLDGIRFDSKAEMCRYQELQLLERAGQITRLERQPEYSLIDPFVDGEGRKHHGVKYRGDFLYMEHGRVVVEDCKGVVTKDYRIKRELFMQRYPGIIFRESKAGQGRFGG